MHGVVLIHFIISAIGTEDFGVLHSHGLTVIFSDEFNGHLKKGFFVVGLTSFAKVAFSVQNFGSRFHGNFSFMYKNIF
jgi:hypothetical protein